MVSNAALREIIGTDPLASVTGAYLRFSFICDFLVPLFLHYLVDTGTKNFHSFVFIFMLRFFILTGHYNTCRQMCNSDSRICSIYALPAWSSGPEYINPQIVLVYIYLYVLHLRQNSYRNCGGVNTPSGFRAGYALNPVYAGFKFQPGVCALSLNGETATVTAEV